MKTKHLLLIFITMLIIAFSPMVNAQCFEFEENENVTVTQGCTISDIKSEGTKSYVTFDNTTNEADTFEKGYIEYSFEIENAGYYEISASIRLSSAKGAFRWYLDGEEIRYYTYMDSFTNQWITIDFDDVHFDAAGSHTFGIKALRGTEAAPNSLDLDNILITPTKNKTLLITNEVKKGNVEADSTATLESFESDAYSNIRLKSADVTIGDKLTVYTDLEYYGNYNVEIFIKGGADRGVYKLYIDDVLVGEQDYSQITTWGSVNYGDVMITSGRKSIVLECTGDDGGKTLMLSQIKLTHKSEGLIISEPVVFDSQENKVEAMPSEPKDIDIECDIGNYTNKDTDILLIAAYYQNVNGYKVLKNIYTDPVSVEADKTKKATIEITGIKANSDDFLRIFVCTSTDGIVIPCTNDVYLR